MATAWLKSKRLLKIIVSLANIFLVSEKVFEKDEVGHSWKPVRLGLWLPVWSDNDNDQRLSRRSYLPGLVLDSVQGDY